MKTTKIKSLAMACLLTTAISSYTSAQDKKEAKEENKDKFGSTSISDDTKFAVAAADAGMLEVMLGQLAEKNASSPEVKALAKHMVDDHTKANNELKALAKKKNITLPTKLSDKCDKRYKELAAKTGKDFDKAYIELMIKDHKDMIDMFKKQTEKGNDSELKAWSSSQMSTLQHHLEMTQSTWDVIKDNMDDKEKIQSQK